MNEDWDILVRELDVPLHLVVPPVAGLNYKNILSI